MTKKDLEQIVKHNFDEYKIITEHIYMIKAEIFKYKHELTDSRLLIENLDIILENIIEII